MWECWQSLNKPISISRFLCPCQCVPGSPGAPRGSLALQEHRVPPAAPPSLLYSKAELLTHGN